MLQKQRGEFEQMIQNLMRHLNMQLVNLIIFFNVRLRKKFGLIPNLNLSVPVVFH